MMRCMTPGGLAALLENNGSLFQRVASRRYTSELAVIGGSRRSELGVMGEDITD